MTEATANVEHSAGGKAPVGVASNAAKLMFFLYNLPYLILYVTTVVLAAMTDADPSESSARWLWFIPAVALVAIAGGWKSHAGDTLQSRGIYLVRQLLHWVALAVVIYFLFGDEMQHFLTSEIDGFVTVFLLGLTALLAGVHCDWKMALFGAFLLLTGMAIVWLEDNALLITLSSSAFFAIALTLLVIFKMKGKNQPKLAEPGTDH